MKHKALVLMTGLALILSACSDNHQAASVSTGSANQAEFDAETAAGPTMASWEEKLPSPYTPENLKSALEEYINHRMWLYPDKLELHASPTNFDHYIGQTLSVEVRLYEDRSGDKRAYGELGINDGRLIAFHALHGMVYSDAVGKEDTEHWPEGAYEVAGTFEVEVREPHRPDYGTSARKHERIAAAETYARNFCEDMLRGEGGDRWAGATVYIEDFYGYQDSSAMWVVRQDDYVWNAPFYFSENNGTVEAVGMKGFGIANMGMLDELDLTRYWFDKGTASVARKFTCSVDDRAT
ncbi:hypothetical protein [Cohnella boryungensis]|uniref:Uncharacterized protein n=1 Tax=Cohnella boryungensis TaxID=768479 RepID=A0ABV8S6X2_9BACL